MSTPNPHSSSATTTSTTTAPPVSRQFSIASPIAPSSRQFTIATTNTVAKTSPPPPPPPSTQQPQRPLPSLVQNHHHSYQPQQPHHLYPNQSIPIRLANTTTSTPTNKTSHHTLPQHPDPSHGIRYPVASSGGGLVSKLIRPSQSFADQVVTVANLGGYAPRLAYSHRPNGSPHFDTMNHPVIKPTHSYPQHHMYHHPHIDSAPVLGSPTPAKGIPVSVHPKVAPPPPSVSDCNGKKNTRERSKDDIVTVIRDRKVRISDDASLYALCRSWLRNGVHEEIQRDYGDCMKSLPRPLPIFVTETDLPKKEVVEEEVEEEHEDDEGSVEHLSASELLKKHVKRAKRVRARLREERQKRIARYKGRLSLLLPPIAEQCRNDNA